MRLFMQKRINKLANLFRKKKLIILSSTGGGGSSFLVDELIRSGYNVCVRPDGGEQKIGISSFEIYKNRTKDFFRTRLSDGCDDLEMFNEAFVSLNSKKKGKYALVCMNWGLKGYFEKVSMDIKPFYLVRDPLFAFNSYSGNGWRSDGGQRRISGLGFESANDPRWVEAWLGEFAHWEKGAKVALLAHRSNRGHLLRYHSLREDASHTNLLPKLENYKCGDVEEKLTCLSSETKLLIREKTAKLWDEILSLSIDPSM